MAPSLTAEQSRAEPEVLVRRLVKPSAPGIDIAASFLPCSLPPSFSSASSSRLGSTGTGWRTWPCLSSLLFSLPVCLSSSATPFLPLSQHAFLFFLFIYRAQGKPREQALKSSPRPLGRSSSSSPRLPLDRNEHLGASIPIQPQRILQLSRQARQLSIRLWRIAQCSRLLQSSQWWWSNAHDHP